jgi:hypothetical protein
MIANDWAFGIRWENIALPAVVFAILASLIVDYIDQQQRDMRFVGRVAMQVFVRLGYVAGSPLLTPETTVAGFYGVLAFFAWRPWPANRRICPRLSGTCPR